MNRLANLTPDPDRRSGLLIVLSHLQDAHPDEYRTALNRVMDRDISATELARLLTSIAKEDNISARVTEKSIRDWRDRQ